MDFSRCVSVTAYSTSEIDGRVQYGPPDGTTPFSEKASADPLRIVYRQRFGEGLAGPSSYS